jgi:predicted tellurium resistance membrane protein TerC
VADGSTALMILGLAISIPLIVAGASLIMALLERLPILVWAGAALLGWIAGDMLISDPWLVGRIGEAISHGLEIPAAALGAVLVVALGYALSRRSASAR